MAYNKEAQKRYNSKTLNFACSYKPNESVEGNRLKQYLTDNNLSANSYIKGLIKKDLDNKGVGDTGDTDSADAANAVQDNKDRSKKLEFWYLD